MFKSKYIILSLIIAVLFTSCDNDDDANVYSTDINEFIWKGLNSWYYWKPQVPYLQDELLQNGEYQNIINGQDPANLFYGLLNDYPNVDRFSWIVDDVDALVQSFSGIQKSSGMDFSLAYLDDSQMAIIGMVNYVVPNSPAANLGIERGDVFYQINGSTITLNNYNGLFEDNFSVTFAETVTVDDDGIQYSGAEVKNIVSTELQENPVHFTQIIENDEHKVGYLVYNAYRANYNDELNDVFADFAVQNITDLVLDLRYNGGGSLASAIALGQMITGQFTNDPYVILDYNDAHNNEDQVIDFESNMNIYEIQNGQNTQVGSEPINSLNLNKIYILTSSSTASASELTIAGLEPYIAVIKIGGQTVGKFVGSRTLVDHANSDYMDYSARNPAHNFAMQPIVFAYKNANNQMYNNGIVPNFEVNFSDYVGTIAEFGNPYTDKALGTAMEQITGNTFRRNTTTHNFRTEFMGSSKTLQKFGTDLYLELD